MDKHLNPCPANTLAMRLKIKHRRPEASQRPVWFLETSRRLDQGHALAAQGYDLQFLTKITFLMIGDRLNRRG